MSAAGKRSPGGRNLLLLGMRRRRKEVLRMRVMTGIAVLFFSLMLLFQDNMNSLQMEMNYRFYGSWFLRTEDGEADLPYLEEQARVLSSVPAIIVTDPEETTGESGFTTAQVLRSEFDDSVDQMALGETEESFFEANRIELREGRMPENPNEIAAEISALQHLGLGYDIGQKFLLIIPTGKVTETKEGPMLEIVRLPVTLTGTLRSFTPNWNDGFRLPQIYISQGSFDILKLQPKTEFYFYALDRDYIGTTLWEAAEEYEAPLKAVMREKDIPSEINRASYMNPFWGNNRMYLRVLLVLMLVSAAMLSWLMSSYLLKRKKYFLQMREIGASVGEITQMAAYECLFAALPVIAFSMLVSYLLSILAVLFVSLAAKVPFFYAFSLKTCLLILGVSLLVIALSIAVSLLIFSRKEVTLERVRIGAAAARSFLRRKKRLEKKGRPYAGIRETLKREERLRRLPRTFSFISGMLILGFVLMCAGRIQESADREKEMRAYVPEIRGFMRRNSPGTNRKGLPALVYQKNGEVKKGTFKEDVSTFAPIYALSKTYQPETISRLSELQGISKMRTCCIDQTHMFTWERKESGQYYEYLLDFMTYSVSSGDLRGNVLYMDVRDEKARRYFLKEAPQHHFMKFVPDPGAVYDGLKKQLKNDTADREAFLTGEQVIVVLGGVGFQAPDAASSDEQKVGSVDGTLSFTGPLNAVGNFKALSGQDDTLFPGQIITIPCKNGDVEVTVAGVVPTSETSEDSMIGNAIYGLIGSEALGRKVAEMDGVSYGYNLLDMTTGAFADEEATEKLAVRELSNGGSAYESNMESLRKLREEKQQRLLSYGFFALAAFVLYLFLCLTMARDGAAHTLAARRKLLLLGGESRIIRREMKLRNLAETLKLSPGILFYVLFSDLMKYYDHLQRLKEAEAGGWTLPAEHTVTLFGRSFTLQHAFAAVLLDSSFDLNLPRLLGITAIFLAAVFLFREAGQQKNQAAE